MFLLRGKTFLIAALGTAAFAFLGLPLPFLFGPMAFCLIAALAGAKLAGFGQVSVAARTILGVAVGASITPDVIGTLPDLAISLALIPLFILIIAAFGVPFFTKVWRLDAPTAYYAAMPGGLQDMVIFGKEAGANPRSLSLIQATRVLIIVTAAPILLTQVYDQHLTNRLGQPASELPVGEMALMVAAALFGWKFGERVGLFGASIIGPMIATAALSLSGLIHVRPPEEAIVTAQFFIGVVIGVHFVGITLLELRRYVFAGISYVLLLAVIATVFAQLVVFLAGVNPVNAFLAFAPGGQAEMTVLAIATGADLGFVIAHHLTRIVVVIVGAPILAKLFIHSTSSR